MPVFQLTLAINKSDRSTGASETYYVEEPDYADADVDLVSLVAARVAILAASWQIEWGRVSKVGVPGDSVLEYFRQVGDIVVADVKAVEQPWSALLTRMEAAAGLNSAITWDFR